MAEKKKSRADKMYGDSPSLKRDEADGKVKAMKPSASEKKSKEVEGGTDGAERESMREGEDMMARHAMDRLAMHHKHESEHHAHKGGDKKEMHHRHISEHKAMMKRHEKELSGTGEDMIEKTEENEKEGAE